MTYSIRKRKLYLKNYFKSPWGDIRLYCKWTSDSKNAQQFTDLVLVNELLSEIEGSKILFLNE